jgi:hypothetical protein
LSGENSERAIEIRNDLLQHSLSFVKSRSIQVAVEIGLPDSIGTSSLSPGEIADRLSLHPGAVERLLRLLCDCGIVDSADSGLTFHLTEKGNLLRTDVPGSLHAWLRLCYRGYAMLGEMQDVMRTGEPSFAKVFGSPFFEYFAENPDEGLIFSKAMSDYSSSLSPAITQTYEFPSDSLVVDVGGGEGHHLRQIVSTAGCRGVIFDLPHSEMPARKAVSDAGLADRISFDGGSFFDGVTEGGDFYLLSWVLHDWDDDDASRILANCRKAMNPTGKVLIFESIIPEIGQAHPSKDFDVLMMVGLGGRERTAVQYKELLTSAGLRLSRIFDTGTPFSVIEAVPA